MRLTLHNLDEFSRNFTKQFVEPHREKVDNEARFPIEAYTKLKECGFMGLLVPEEYGGLGAKSFEHAKICYYLAQGDASVSLCYMMHNVATSILVKYGTEHQKNMFLPKIANGEISLTLAYSESGSGTHFINPDMSESSIQNDEKRILNGQKSFVTAAEFADYYMSITNSCVSIGNKNNWIVPSNHKNLIHQKDIWNGLGMRGNVSKPVEYNGVDLSVKDYLLGKDGEGEEQLNFVALFFVAGLGGVYSGLGEAAYQCILKHCKTRQYTNGKFLSNNEIVRMNLATLYTKAQSQIALVKEATRAFDNNEDDANLKLFACRISATELVMDICSLAMRLGGGKAYSKLLPLEQYLRDCYASQVMAPSIDVLKMWLGEAINSNANK